MDDLLYILERLTSYLAVLTLLSFIWMVFSSHSDESDTAFFLFQLFCPNLGCSFCWLMLLEHKEATQPFCTALTVLLSIVTVGILIHTVLHLWRYFRKGK